MQRRRAIWLGGLALVAAFALIASACGGSNNESSGATTTQSTTSSSSKTFANFRIAYDTGLDYMDPGLSYTVEGWEIMWNEYIPLLTYKHVNGPDGATIIPGLAEALPTISNGNKTYTLTLKKGRTYSDGTPVKASDFKSTIKRLFLIDSPGVGFFSNIVGADQFSKTKKGDISGITTDDATGKITINLTAPQGDFVNILATTFAAPVPANTPAKDQSTTPIPSTGPYMTQSYKPNRQVVVVRNPKWKPIDGIPNGNPDKMTIALIEDDNTALQTVISGTNDYDFHAIPVDRLAEVQKKHGSQLKLYTPANTYYFFMNTRLKPFDNLKVRQAVNYAIDRDAIVRIYGGLAQPTENVLPPTYPQYKKISMYPHNLAKAKALIKAAGVTGTAVTVWGSNRDQPKQDTEYLADVLNSIGLKATPKIIDASIYWSTVGNQATKAQIGFADWFQDYPHPLDWFDVLLNGDRITQTHNNNYSNADVAAINQKINQLKKQPQLDNQANTEWANVDKMVAENALWAPFVNRQFTDFFGTDIDLSDGCYVNHVLYQFDFSQICHK